MLKSAITPALTLCLLGLGACGGGGETETAPAETAAVETAVADAAAATEEAASEAAETVEAAAATVAEDAEAAAGDAADAVEEAAAGAAEAAEEAAADVTEAAEEAAADATAAAEEAVDEVTEAAAPDTGAAQTYEIQMYNRDPNNPAEAMVFIPRVLQVNVGDTVTFVPTDLSHQSASTDGMIPEGAEGWNGRINQPVSYTFEQPGIYGYQCIPHLAAGMVGLVVVDGPGKLDNLEAAKSVRQVGLASRRWPQIWEEAEAAGYLSE